MDVGKRVIDCFCFLNELELLELRLRELSDTVDYFVLCEANRTHTGMPKEFVFEQNADRYKDYLDKIIHVKVYDLPDPTPEGDCWNAEKFQRNAISRGLGKIASGGDVVLLSDVDEIPNTDIIREHYSNPTRIVFKQKLYYYYVNLQVRRNWGGTVMAPYGSFPDLQHLRRTAIRHSMGTYPPSNPIAGWHYSYLTGGDAEKIFYKSQCISDYFGTLEVGGIEGIQQKVKELRDPYGRDEIQAKRYMRTRIVDIEDYKPRCMDWFLEKYPHFFYKGKGI